MFKKLRMGVVGLGNMGKNHVRNYSEIENVDLIAVCDVQKEIVEGFASQYKCHGYTDLDEMIAKENLDGISVVVPTKFHFEIAKKIIENKINILIEKPIADTVEHAKKIIEIANINNVTLMIGHIERFNPAVIKMKELVDSGVLGKVTSIIGKRVGAFPAQIKDANVIIDLAVHDVDIFSYLLNKQPDRVFSNAGRALAKGREDYAEIFLTYGDQNAFLQVNWITPIRIRSLAITGTKGYAELNYMTQGLTLYESNYYEDFDNFGDYIIKFGVPNKKEIKVERQEPLRQELLHFVESINNKQIPLISGEVGTKALEIACEIMEKMTNK